MAVYSAGQLPVVDLVLLLGRGPRADPAKHTEVKLLEKSQAG